MAVLQGNQNEIKPNPELIKRAEGLSTEGLSNETLQNTEATVSPSLDKDKLSLEEIQSRLAAPGESVVSKEIGEQATASLNPEVPVKKSPQMRLNEILHGDKEAFADMDDVLGIVKGEQDPNSLN